MEAPAENIRVRSSYNVAGISFNPRELADAIRRKLPKFEMICKPDFRQAIAASWPQSIDDTYARADWGWKAAVGLDDMVADMLANVQVANATLQQAA
jgi:nucleoside-diphosphate-sugar epimerase